MEKVVNKSCSDNSIFNAVEEYDTQNDGCFNKCSLTQNSGARNTSDACWIYCFYRTVLGPGGLMPGNFWDIAPELGMPLHLLDGAFEKPFLPESQGGCPNIVHAAPLLRSSLNGNAHSHNTFSHAQASIYAQLSRALAI